MWPIYLGVIIQGVLTGLVYGLMALGLSVIFGIVRIVNFAHGEFAVIAMYAASVEPIKLKMSELSRALAASAIACGKRPPVTISRIVSLRRKASAGALRISASICGVTTAWVIPGSQKDW